MSNSQSHGKTLENIIIQTRFPTCPTLSAHEKWDVPAKYDVINNLPTSIKTTGSNTIGLADARTFWATNVDYRLLVVRYIQNKDIKTINKIVEYIITSSEHKNLLSGVPLVTVEQFHNTLLTYKKGTVKGARLWATTENKQLKQTNCLVALNPKISDSGSTQRRLQCSISFNNLQIVSSSTTYTNTFYGLQLPFDIQSSSRKL